DSIFCCRSRSDPLVWPRILRHGVQSGSVLNFRGEATGEQSAEVDFLSLGNRTDDLGSTGRNSGVHFEGVLRVLPAFGGLGIDNFPALAARVSAYTFSIAVSGFGTLLSRLISASRSARAISSMTSPSTASRALFGVP